MTTDTETTTTAHASFSVEFEKRAEARRDNGCNTGMGDVWFDEEDNAWMGAVNGFGAQTWFTGAKATATEAMDAVARHARRTAKAETVGCWVAAR